MPDPYVFDHTAAQERYDVQGQSGTPETGQTHARPDGFTCPRCGWPGADVRPPVEPEIRYIERPPAEAQAPAPAPAPAQQSYLDALLYPNAPTVLANTTTNFALTPARQDIISRLSPAPPQTQPSSRASLQLDPGAAATLQARLASAQPTALQSTGTPVGQVATAPGLTPAEAVKLAAARAAAVATPRSVLPESVFLASLRLERSL